MPTYDYACAACGEFDALRGMSQRDQPAPCPRCGVASPRVFVAAPRLALMDFGARTALTVNERARHEPKSSQEVRLRHPAGCGCCSSRRQTATVTAGNGNKAFPSRRPWMISH